MELLELLVRILEEQLQVTFELAEYEFYSVAHTVNSYGDILYLCCEGTKCSAGLTTDDFTPFEMMPAQRIAAHVDSSLNVFVDDLKRILRDPIPWFLAQGRTQYGGGYHTSYISYRMLKATSKDDLLSFMARIVAEEKRCNRRSCMNMNLLVTAAGNLKIEEAEILNDWARIEKNVEIAYSLL